MVLTMCVCINGGYCVKVMMLGGWGAHGGANQGESWGPAAGHFLRVSYSPRSLNPNM